MLISCVVSIAARAAHNGYAAAFVEHTATSPCGSGVCGAATLAQNIATLARHAATAGSNGAQIIVFPEYGITGFSSYPKQAWISGGYAVAIPLAPAALDARVVPCAAAARFPAPIVALSCAARSARIALVANLVDHNVSTGTLFNTDVAFDTDGAYLAKYAKQNLWGEANIDVPQSCPLATFTTNFGVTFGLLTCADLIYARPAAALLAAGVTDFVVPLAWSNAMAQMQILPWAQAFSLTHSVNLVVANHKTRSESGSAAIERGAVLAYEYALGARDGAVHVARFGAAAARTAASEGRDRAGARHRALLPPPQSRSSHRTAFPPSPWAFARLAQDGSAVTVCAAPPSTLCCHTAATATSGTAYVLAALDGDDTDAGVAWSAQACALLYCPAGEASARCLAYHQPGHELEPALGLGGASARGSPRSAASTKATTLGLLSALTLRASGLGLGAGGLVFPEVLVASPSAPQRLMPPLPDRAPNASDVGGGFHFIDCAARDGNATLFVRAPSGASGASGDASGDASGGGISSVVLYGRAFARDQLPYACPQ